MKTLSKKIAAKVFGWFGLKLLDHEETVRFLTPDQVSRSPEDHLVLPAVDQPFNRGGKIFNKRSIANDPVFVWRRKRQRNSDSLSYYGFVSSGDKVFCPDFGFKGFYRGFLGLKQREPLKAGILIALSAHYPDPISFGGYYDYVLLIAAKLCRIKDALSPEEFSSAVVSYPFFDTNYEREYLELLGIAPGKQKDSKAYKISFDEVVLGNSGHWFYPNSADILSLKKYVENAVETVTTDQKRIYVSRKGRRRILNEDELIPLLERYDFTIIEDRERSVAEQVNIYRNASFIIGPHGASFANIIWCSPGAHLLELFSPGYMPDFFQYIAKVVGLNYSAYHFGPPPRKRSVVHTLGEDIRVDISEIEQLLQNLL